MAISVELEKMYYEDKNDRETLDYDDAQVAVEIDKRDKKRLQRVKEIESSIDTTEIWNCHYLAYLFLHGETVEDYKKAYHYAKKAVDMGSNVTKWLYAAAWDRYLVAQDKPQKYGTQFKKVKGKWEQLPVDNTITDEEREDCGVAPLDKALETFLKNNSK